MPNKRVKTWLWSLLLLLVCGNVLAARAADDLQDPTKPSNEQGSSFSQSVDAKQEFSLTSILISPRRRFAVINNKYYHVGDQIEGVSIIAIETNKVLLQGVGGVSTLNLLPDIIE